MCRDVIVRVAAITSGLSAVIWAVCQFDFACVLVDVRVVLCKPGVPQDDCLMANARDVEFGRALMTLVLHNKIDRFSDISDLVWRSVCTIQPDQTWKLIGSKLVRSDKLMVNKYSRYTAYATVYQCFHCQWTVAVDRVDLDGDIGGPPKYLVLKGLSDSLLPFGSGISQFGCFGF